jgi:hypothetical protein
MMRPSAQAVMRTERGCMRLLAEYLTFEIPIFEGGALP